MLSCQLKQDKKPCFIGFLSKLISLANGISEKSRQRAVVRQCRYWRFLHQGTCRTTVQVAYFSATVSILEVFALGYVSYQGTYRSIVREFWATDPLNRKQPNINFRMSGNSYNIFFILFFIICPPVPRPEISLFRLQILLYIRNSTGCTSLSIKISYQARDPTLIPSVP